MNVAASSGAPDIVFYCAGALIGAAGGGLQASSRPLLVDQTTTDRMGEAFGLYALPAAPRPSSRRGPSASSQRCSRASASAITPILALFVIGMALLIPVRSRT